jgi:hypothetical protein
MVYEVEYIVFTKDNKNFYIRKEKVECANGLEAYNFIKAKYSDLQLYIIGIKK